MAGTPPTTGKSVPSPSDVATTTGPIRFFFQEFLVDIFGGLVPGLVFLAGVWTALPLAVHMLYETASGKTYGPSRTSAPTGESLTLIKTIGEAIGHVPATVWFFLFLGLIIVVYVFGQVFYRRGPKDADQASFSNMEKREMLSLCLALSAPRGSDEPVVKKFQSLKLDALRRTIRKSWIGRWVLKTRWWRIHQLLLWISPRTRSEARSALRDFMRDNYGADSKEQCEFPYDYLDRYLKKRKLDHLVALVPWRVDEGPMPDTDDDDGDQGGDGTPVTRIKALLLWTRDAVKALWSWTISNTAALLRWLWWVPSPPREEGADEGVAGNPRSRRSKVYINVLKIRLMQLFPQRCKQMVRNEADVRLASGVWHAAGTLRYVAIAGLGAYLVAYMVQNRYVAYMGWLSPTHWRLFLEDYFWGLVAASAVLVLAVYFRTRIEQFLHYQRMREVVYVLDTAYAAFRSDPELLVPPFDGFVEWVAEQENRGADRRSSVRTERRVGLADGAVLTNISEDYKGVCLEAVFDQLRFKNGQVTVGDFKIGSARWLKQISPAVGDPPSARVRVGVAAESPDALRKISEEPAHPFPAD